MPPGSDPDGARRPARPEDLGSDRSLLILDDDEPFLRRLGRAMEKRGFEVTGVDSVAAAGSTSLAGFCSGSRVAEAGFTSGSFSAAVFSAASFSAAFFSSS